MSNRRSRQASSSSRISDDQITDLISKLRQSIPEIRQNRRSSTVKCLNKNTYMYKLLCILKFEFYDKIFTQG